MSKIRLSNMIYRKLFFLVTFCLFKTVIAQVNYDSIFQKAMQKMNNQDFSNAYWELKLIDSAHSEINEAVAMTFLPKIHCLFMMKKYTWISKEYWYCMKYLPKDLNVQHKVCLFNSYCAAAFLELDSVSRAEAIMNQINGDFLFEPPAYVYYLTRLKLMCNNNAQWKSGKITKCQTLFDSCINEIDSYGQHFDAGFLELVNNNFIYYFFKYFFNGMNRRTFLPSIYFDKCRGAFYKYSEKGNYFDYYVFREYYESYVGNDQNEFKDSICSFSEDLLSDAQREKLSVQPCRKMQISRVDSIFKKREIGIELAPDDLWFLVKVISNNDFFDDLNQYERFWQLGLNLLGSIDNINFVIIGTPVCSLVKSICIKNFFYYDSDCRVVNRDDINEAQIEILKLIVKIQKHYGFGTVKDIWDINYLIARKFVMTPNLFGNIDVGNRVLDTAFNYAIQSLPSFKYVNATMNPNLSLIKEILILRHHMFLQDSTNYYTREVDSVLQDQIVRTQNLIYENYKGELSSNILNLCTRYFYEDDSYRYSLVHLGTDAGICDRKSIEIIDDIDYRYKYKDKINSTVLNWLFINQDISAFILKPVISAQSQVDMEIKKSYLNYVDSQILNYSADKKVNSADAVADLIWEKSSARKLLDSFLQFDYHVLKKNMDENEISIFVHAKRLGENVQFALYFFDKIQPDCSVLLTKNEEISSLFNPKSKKSMYRDTAALSISSLLRKITKNMNKINVFSDDIGGYINFSVLINSDDDLFRDVRMYRSVHHYKNSTSHSFNKAIFIGGLDYGVAKENEIPENEKITFNSGFRWGQKGMAWQYLPNSLSEVTNCAKVLNKKNLILTGKDVTTNTIRKCLQNEKKYILHFATHGYIIDDGNHPFLSVGLALSNANKGSENSLFTFYDILKTDLSNCELAVFSACNSGKSYFLNRGQCYDIRRALEIAGVKYSITALWEIPDRESALFFEYFYNEISKGNSIENAFAKTQYEFSLQFDLFYWGAFVLNMLN